MKLLKIGSSPSCNVVIGSPYVSGVHAELTLLDNGEIFIEDKNSTNGTFVNGQKLTPNVETAVRRGDKITLGNVDLQWHQVPALDNPSKYKSILNIGTSHRCDINIDSQFASRYHATVFVDKKGNCFIQDNDSKNGTEVNGNKIAKGKKVPLKHSDQVVVADVDVTEQLKPLIPNPYGWVKKVIIGFGAAAMVLGVIYGISKILGPVGPEGGKDSEATLAQVQSAVVMVHSVYNIFMELENNPIQDGIWMAYSGTDIHISKSKKTGRIWVASGSLSGTAFFLDREGRLGTNRHVAVPWEDESEAQQKEWRSEAERLLAEKEEIFYPMIVNQTKALGKDMAYASSLLRQLQNSKFKIVGELDYFGIAYPNRMYEGYDEFSRCNILDYSEQEDIDLALIQLNDPHTPESVEFVFSPENFVLDKIEPQKERLTWIGYPKGDDWGLDDKIKKVRPQVRETMCSSMPSKYYFDVQGDIVSGASGSPVFTTDGKRLVGIAFARLRDGATYGRAIHAKYLKEMYDKETK